MTDDIIAFAKTGAIGPKREVNPLEKIEIDLELNLRGESAKRCLEIAERRKQDPAEMLLAVLHHAIDDDMVDAIIDDGEGA